MSSWEFPGCPVIRTWPFHSRALGSIPGQGTKIPQAARQGQKKKKVFLQTYTKMYKENNIKHLQLQYPLSLFFDYFLISF